MNTAFRRIVVSGSAAVAVLGGAAAVTAASAPAAHAAEAHTAEAHTATNAITAPVSLPDGRTLRVVGMGGYGHQASPAHTATVAAFATDQDPADITTGVTPNGGSGSALTNPQQQMPPGYNGQYQTQAGGGTITVTVAVGIGLLIGVGVMVKRGSVKFVPAAACVALGVYLAPTFVGPLVQQLGGSVGVGLGNVWSGF